MLAELTALSSTPVSKETESIQETLSTEGVAMPETPLTEPDPNLGIVPAVRWPISDKPTEPEPTPEMFPTEPVPIPRPPPAEPVHVLSLIHI